MEPWIFMVEQCFGADSPDPSGPPQSRGFFMDIVDKHPKQGTGMEYLICADQLGWLKRSRCRYIHVECLTLGR